MRIYRSRNTSSRCLCSNHCILTHNRPPKRQAAPRSALARAAPASKLHLKVAAELWLISKLETAHSWVTKCCTASVESLAELLKTRSIMAGSTAIATICHSKHAIACIKGSTHARA